MGRAERMGLVAQACADLWRDRLDITTPLVAERVFYRGDWSPGWDTTRRYVRDFLRGMKERGEAQVWTEGSDHWNEAGTAYYDRLTERGRRWLKMMHGHYDIYTGQPF